MAAGGLKLSGQVTPVPLYCGNETKHRGLCGPSAYHDASSRSVAAASDDCAALYVTRVRSVSGSRSASYEGPSRRRPGQDSDGGVILVAHRVPGPHAEQPTALNSSPTTWATPHGSQFTDLSFRSS